MLWRIGPATVDQIVSDFPVKDRPNYKTTHSFLRIMEAKGFVTHTVAGKAFVFEPLIEEEKVATASVQTVLKQTFGGSVTGLMMNLLETGKVRPEELEEIEAMISAYRKSRQAKETP